MELELVPPEGSVAERARREHAADPVDVLLAPRAAELHVREGDHGDVGPELRGQGLYRPYRGGLVVTERLVVVHQEDGHPGLADDMVRLGARLVAPPGALVGPEMGRRGVDERMGLVDDGQVLRVLQAGDEAGIRGVGEVLAVQAEAEDAVGLEVAAGVDGRVMGL